MLQFLLDQPHLMCLTHCPGLTRQSFSGSEAPGVAFKSPATSTDLAELTGSSLLAELLLK